MFLVFHRCVCHFHTQPPHWISCFHLCAHGRCGLSESTWLVQRCLLAEQIMCGKNKTWFLAQFLVVPNYCQRLDDAPVQAAPWCLQVLFYTYESRTYFVLGHIRKRQTEDRDEIQMYVLSKPLLGVSIIKVPVYLFSASHWKSVTNWWIVSSFTMFWMIFSLTWEF